MSNLSARSFISNNLTIVRCVLCTTHTHSKCFGRWSECWGARVNMYYRTQIENKLEALTFASFGDGVGVGVLWTQFEL